MKQVRNILVVFNTPYSDILYYYDPVGNVTQVVSACSWLQNMGLAESFTYDAADQLTAAAETLYQSYQLSVNYGNWGRINSYTLNQKDLLQNTTQSEAHAYTYPVSGSLGDCQTMFAPEQRTITDANNNVATETLAFGINGSLRKRELQAQASYTEYYLFNSAANMKAYSYDKTDFAYYGYNASNTRTYKLNFLNANSWVNGQQLPIHPQSIQAMFYPNTYLNFNQNGEYTKHYYNGSERIASRLGNTALSISMEMTDRLQERVGKLETRFQDDIRELVYSNVQVETPPVSVSSLQSTGTATDIFYYHTNHLGSTAYVTDNNATITQGFLYAPFGEITTEYAPLWQNGTLPKYAFNAKELDEETGMYYYEARYYKPPVFTSRDPMFEKYFWMTPYAYCANNPVKYVDPSGEKIWIVGEDGSEVEYSYGMNSEGLDEFSVKVINALNTIYSTNTGKELIDDLVESSNTFDIKKSEENVFKENSPLKAYKQQYMTDLEFSETYNSIEKSIFDGGSGGTVQWNPSGTMLPTTEGGKKYAIIDLAHELFHAKDANHGLLDDRLEKGIKRCEWQAVYGENMLRKEMKVPLRKYYGIEVDSNNKYIGGTGTKMIKAGEPIKPWW